MEGGCSHYTESLFSSSASTVEVESQKTRRPARVVMGALNGWLNLATSNADSIMLQWVSQSLLLAAKSLLSLTMHPNGSHCSAGITAVATASQCFTYGI